MTINIRKQQRQSKRNEDGGIKKAR